MFDKENFSDILTQIYRTYNNQRDFAETTGVNRAYLSQYMNRKLENPPSPKILERIAKASNKLITYEELMRVCGYTENYSLSPIELLTLSQEQDNLKKEKREAIKKLNLTYDEYKLYTSLCMLTNDTEDIEIQLNDMLKDYNEYSEGSKNKIKKAVMISEKYSNKEWALTEKRLNSIKIKENPQFYMCPVYGQISAGQPNWAEENIEGRIPIDPNLFDIIDPEECFFLRVNGESMNKVIRNRCICSYKKTRCSRKWRNSSCSCKWI